MTQLDEAVARYHKLLDSENYRDLQWADSLHEELSARDLLFSARPISPVLRPHFLTQRQYANLTKAAESLHSAIDRVESLALSNPALMSRMAMLPAEKMLASVDPGYPYLAVTSLLDASIHNGSLQVVDYSADTPAGVAYGEALANIYYDLPPVKEFRKKFQLSKIGGIKPLLQGLLKAYKEFGGKRHPNIAILEYRQPFQTSESREFSLLGSYFSREGYQTQVVLPDQLEYRDGILRKGDFRIDVVYRRMRLNEFLMRFDLNHPVVRAYRDRAICMVNSFRSEMAQKKAIFDLLTDNAVTANFPASERKAIRDFVPWTRVVAATKTTYKDEVVDLHDFILKNRERLMLKPNDGSGENQSYVGSQLDAGAWERALKASGRGNSYVVQEVTAPATFEFPVHRGGALEMVEMRADVQPHISLGRVTGCSTWLAPANSNGGFSTLAGLAPTFILDSK